MQIFEVAAFRSFAPSSDDDDDGKKPPLHFCGGGAEANNFFLTTTNVAVCAWLPDFGVGVADSLLTGHVLLDLACKY